MVTFRPLTLACLQLMRLVLRGHYSHFSHVWANFGLFLSLVFRTGEIPWVVVFWASLGVVDD